jgi:hypothetical protein
MLRSRVTPPLEDLIIEIRAHCGKCQKEFILNLKNYLPGKFHSCSACGNVIHFNDAVAEKIQLLTKELEAMIREAIEDVHKLR